MILCLEVYSYLAYDEDNKFLFYAPTISIQQKHTLFKVVLTWIKHLLWRCAAHYHFFLEKLIGGGASSVFIFDKLCLC